MRFRAFLYATMATTLACAACAADEIKWTEEVKLSDGRVIQLQRKVQLTVSGFPVQERGFVKYSEMCYPPMNVRWKSSGGFQPDIFDIVDGKAYVHVPISGCISCNYFGYPATDAIYFVWEKGVWKQIKHEEFPARSEWNLLISPVAPAGHESDDPHGLLTLKDKERRPSGLRIEQQKKGWKRVNESGQGIGRCNACRNVMVQMTGTLEVLVNDGGATCSN